jgi:hypothetical protein
MGEKPGRWGHWSTNEKVAAVILISVLAYSWLCGALYSMSRLLGLGCAERSDLNLVPKGKISTSSH